MSLEKIAEHIEKETDMKVKKIIIEAQLNSNESLKEADKKAEEMIKEAKKKAANLSEEKAAVDAAKTNVERNNLIKNAVSGAFKDSMNNLYSAEEKFSGSGKYEKLMNLLIKEAKKKLGEDAVLFMNKGDIQSFGKKEKNARESRKRIFGVYAESADGRLSMDLSLGKVIQSLEEKIARKIIDKLEK